MCIQIWKSQAFRCTKFHLIYYIEDTVNVYIICMYMLTNTTKFMFVINPGFILKLFRYFCMVCISKNYFVLWTFYLKVNNRH